MREKSRWNRNRWLALVVLAPAFREAIVDPALKVDKGAVRTPVRRGGGDRSCSRTGVEADQYEACQMTKGALLRFDLLSLAWAPMSGLNFLRAPADPQELGRFVTSEPTGAGRSFERKDHVHDSAVQSLFRMMIDGGAKIFKIAAGAAYRAPPPYKLSARFTGHLREVPRSPKFIEPLEASIELWMVGLPSSAGLVIGKENIGNSYLFEFSLLPTGAVLLGEIGTELDLRLCSFALKASCGDMAIAVEDDPGCPSDDLARSVPLGGAEP
jgi:hypothetical protein